MMNRLNWDDTRLFLALARHGTLSGAGAGVGSGGDLQAETSAAPTAMMPASNQWLRFPVERGEGVSCMV